MTITFDPALVIQLVVSSILPLFVGLVTKLDSKSWVRAVLLAALTLLSTLGTELLRAVQEGVSYDLGRGLIERHRLPAENCNASDRRGHDQSGVAPFREG